MIKDFLVVVGQLNKLSRILILILACFRAALGILDLIGIALLGLVLGRATSQFTSSDDSLTTGNLEWLSFFNDLTLFQLGLFSLVLFLTKSILALLTMRYTAIKLSEIETDIAINQFKRFLNHPNPIIAKNSKQKLNYALTHGASSSVVKLISVVITIFSETLLLILISLLFAIVNLPITIAICFYFAFVGLLLFKFVSSKFALIGRNSAESTIATQNTVEESVNSIREIKSLGKQNEFISKFAKNRILFARANALSDFLTAVPRYIVESALMLGAIALAGYSFRTSSAVEAASQIGIFLTGGLRIMASMLPLQNSLGTIKQLGEQAKSFIELIELQKNSLANEFEIQKFSTNPAKIEFRNVAFTYPESKQSAVLNLNFEIEAGKTVAFIGPSGAGKSTIADLICGIENPTIGTVTVSTGDGLKPRISYVPQNPGLIKGSIAENITLNVHTKNFNFTELNRAVKSSHLDSLVNSLADGLYSDLGEQVDALSGGQLQRIGIARALYETPGLLILDEATSSLDAETEAAITENLKELQGKTTIVVIAHRLSTVQNSDCVFVVENGEIVASGKFSDLAKTNELVSRYVSLSKLI